MRPLFQVILCLAVGGILILGAQTAAGQTPADAQTAVTEGPPYFDGGVRFWTGQDVSPTFDGWFPNDDGTFTLVFGYFNRNYEEELVIPPGPNNNISPGDIDQGQPTIFVPRRERFVFLMKVPKDFGDKQIIWSLTSHGRTEKTTAKLTRELLISKHYILSHASMNPNPDDPDKPPSISFAPLLGEAKVSTPLIMTAIVSDDGLPKPIVYKAPVSVGGGQVGSPGGGRRRGNLTVRWLPYRGSGGVKINDKGPIEVSGGKKTPSGPGGPVAVEGASATTEAHFALPGTYQLMAIADDTDFTTSELLTVNVGQ